MERESSLKEKVQALFDHNHRVGGTNGRSYDYTCPSPGMYPHQWLWDSSFHAVVLSHIEPERSKREIKTLLSKQAESGLVPCVSIWEKRFPLEGVVYATRLTQTPVIPISVETIYEKTHDREFVAEVYPGLKKLFDWLSIYRDRNQNGLIEIIHPWEAGTDSIPSFDRQLGIKSAKPSARENFSALYKLLAKYQIMGWNEDKIFKSKIFINENMVFNSGYAKSLFSMVKLAKVAGREDEATVFAERYKKTRDALLTLCWSEEDKMFYDLDENGRQIRAKSITSLMPLILPDLPDDVVKALVDEHLLNEKEFWTPFPVASVPRSGGEFNPGSSLILSRGPTWAETNWFLTKALAEKGYESAARFIVEKTTEMIEKSGFREFYNPLTGEGYGQRDFTWSGLVLDMDASTG